MPTSTAFTSQKKQIDIQERLSKFLAQQAHQRRQPHSIDYLLRPVWSLRLRLIPTRLPHLMEGRRQSAATKSGRGSDAAGEALLGRGLETEVYSKFEYYIGPEGAYGGVPPPSGKPASGSA